MKKETVNRIGYGVKSRPHWRRFAEPLPRGLVWQLDLEHDSPAVVVPVPVRGSFELHGIEKRVAVTLDPRPR
jgi:hypothetical protein